MALSRTDVHHRIISLLATAATIVLIAQAASNSAKKNETGVFACSVVFFGYLVHLIGCLEQLKCMSAFGMNLAMFAHGYQLAYYYFTPLPVGIMLPPLLLCGLFVVYAVANECGVFEPHAVTRSTETDGECEDESKHDFHDVELV